MISNGVISMKKKKETTTNKNNTQQNDNNDRREKKTDLETPNLDQHRFSRPTGTHPTKKGPVSYTHHRAHETRHDIEWRHKHEKKKRNNNKQKQHTTKRQQRQKRKKDRLRDTQFGPTPLLPPLRHSPHKIG